ncbi:MAG: IS5 family transposase [Pseudomonadota bacterium]
MVQIKGAGRFRKFLSGLTTKVLALTDIRGRPAALKLTLGQAHDLSAVDDLIEAVPPDTIMLADKAYDTDDFIDALNERQICPNIPNKANRKEPRGFFKSLYKHRNQIERFFGKLKHFRRVATRYEKRADNYLAMCELASARVIMRDL